MGSIVKSFQEAATLEPAHFGFTYGAESVREMKEALLAGNIYFGRGFCTFIALAGGAHAKIKSLDRVNLTLNEANKDDEDNPKAWLANPANKAKPRGELKICKGACQRQRRDRQECKDTEGLKHFEQLGGDDFFKQLKEDGEELLQLGLKEE